MTSFAQTQTGLPTALLLPPLLPLLLQVVCISFFLTLFSTQVHSAVETLEFSSPEKKVLYRKLTQELRCLKCQNQNLADSPAGLAEDLKREIFNMTEAGKTSSEVIDFMVSRYGDFILYRPAIKPLTLVLWVLPFLLLVVGVFVVFRFANASRSRAAGSSNTGVGGAAAAAIDEGSLARARELLAEPLADQSASATPAEDSQHSRGKSSSLPTDRV